MYSSRILRIFLAFTVSAFQIPIPSFAAPSLPTYNPATFQTNGSANTTNPNSTTMNVNVTSTGTTNLQWSTFNIANGYTVDFNLVNSGDTVINTVSQSGGASNINGNLNSFVNNVQGQGNVWLLNPNGILFGASANVNVGGLLAAAGSMTEHSNNSTLDPQNYWEYQAPKTARFTNGEVINNGKITIGQPNSYAALIGTFVQNSGTITANQGSILLAAAGDAYITLPVELNNPTGIDNAPDPSANRISFTLNSAVPPGFMAGVYNSNATPSAPVEPSAQALAVSKNSGSSSNVKSNLASKNSGGSNPQATLQAQGGDIFMEAYVNNLPTGAYAVNTSGVILANPLAQTVTTTINTSSGPITKTSTQYIYGSVQFEDLSDTSNQGGILLGGTINANNIDSYANNSSVAFASGLKLSYNAFEIDTPNNPINFTNQNFIIDPTSTSNNGPSEDAEFTLIGSSVDLNNVNINALSPNSEAVIDIEGTTGVNIQNSTLSATSEQNFVPTTITPTTTTQPTNEASLNIQSSSGDVTLNNTTLEANSAQNSSVNVTSKGSLVISGNSNLNSKATDEASVEVVGQGGVTAEGDQFIASGAQSSNIYVGSNGEIDLSGSQLTTNAINTLSSILRINTIGDLIQHGTLFNYLNANNYSAELINSANYDALNINNPLEGSLNLPTGCLLGTDPCNTDSDIGYSLNGDVLTITLGPGLTTLDWNTFNIGLGYTVDFDLQNASDTVINKVTQAGSTSLINGDLNSFVNGVNGEGNVWLLNPYGIIFGNTANINVGGLLAGSGTISSNSYLNSNNIYVNTNSWEFQSATPTVTYADGQVINNGSITIGQPNGYAALLGNFVQNTGTVTANSGSIALGAGQDMTLQTPLSGIPLSLIVNTSISPTSADNVISAVVNNGTLTASGGNIALEANINDLPYSFDAIDSTGVLTANEGGSVNISAIGLPSYNRQADIGIEGNITTDNINVQTSNGSITLSNGTLSNGSLSSTPSNSGNFNFQANNINIDNEDIGLNAQGNTTIDITGNDGLSLTNSTIIAKGTDNATVNLTTSLGSESISGGSIEAMTDGASAGAAAVNLNAMNELAINNAYVYASGNGAGINIQGTNINATNSQFDSEGGTTAGSSSNLSFQANSGNINMLNNTLTAAGQGSTIGLNASALDIAQTSMDSQAVNSAQGSNVKISSLAGDIDLNDVQLTSNSTGGKALIDVNVVCEGSGTSNLNVDQNPITSVGSSFIATGQSSADVELQSVGNVLLNNAPNITSSSQGGTAVINIAAKGGSTTINGGSINATSQSNQAATNITSSGLLRIDSNAQIYATGQGSSIGLTGDGIDLNDTGLTSKGGNSSHGASINLTSQDADINLDSVNFLANTTQGEAVIGINAGVPNEQFQNINIDKNNSFNSTNLPSVFSASGQSAEIDMNASGNLYLSGSSSDASPVAPAKGTANQKQVSSILHDDGSGVPQYDQVSATGSNGSASINLVGNQSNNILFSKLTALSFYNSSASDSSNINIATSGLLTLDNSILSDKGNSSVLYLEGNAAVQILDDTITSNATLDASQSINSGVTANATIDGSSFSATGNTAEINFNGNLQTDNDNINAQGISTAAVNFDSTSGILSLINDYVTAKDLAGTSNVILSSLLNTTLNGTSLVSQGTNSTVEVTSGSALNIQNYANLQSLGQTSSTLKLTSEGDLTSSGNSYLESSAANTNSTVELNVDSQNGNINLNNTKLTALGDGANIGLTAVGINISTSNFDSEGGNSTGGSSINLLTTNGDLDISSSSLTANAQGAEALIKIQAENQGNNSSTVGNLNVDQNVTSSFSTINAQGLTSDIDLNSDGNVTIYGLVGSTGTKISATATGSGDEANISITGTGVFNAQSANLTSNFSNGDAAIGISSNSMDLNGSSFVSTGIDGSVSLNATGSITDDGSTLSGIGTNQNGTVDITGSSIGLTDSSIQAYSYLSSTNQIEGNGIGLIDIQTLNGDLTIDGGSYTAIGNTSIIKLNSSNYVHVFDGANVSAQGVDGSNLDLNAGAQMELDGSSFIAEPGHYSSSTIVPSGEGNAGIDFQSAGDMTLNNDQIAVTSNNNSILKLTAGFLNTSSSSIPTLTINSSTLSAYGQSAGMNILNDASGNLTINSSTLSSTSTLGRAGYANVTLSNFGRNLNGQGNITSNSNNITDNQLTLISDNPLTSSATNVNSDTIAVEDPDGTLNNAYIDSVLPSFGGNITINSDDDVSITLSGLLVDLENDSFIAQTSNGTASISIEGVNGVTINNSDFTAASANGAASISVDSSQGAVSITNSQFNVHNEGLLSPSEESQISITATNDINLTNTNLNALSQQEEAGVNIESYGGAVSAPQININSSGLVSSGISVKADEGNVDLSQGSLNSSSESSSSGGSSTIQITGDDLNLENITASSTGDSSAGSSGSISISANSNTDTGANGDISMDNANLNAMSADSASISLGADGVINMDQASLMATASDPGQGMASLSINNADSINASQSTWDALGPNYSAISILSTNDIDLSQADFKSNSSDGTSGISIGSSDGAVTAPEVNITSSGYADTTNSASEIGISGDTTVDLSQATLKSTGTTINASSVISVDGGALTLDKIISQSIGGNAASSEFNGYSIDLSSGNISSKGTQSSALDLNATAGNINISNSTLISSGGSAELSVDNSFETGNLNLASSSLKSQGVTGSSLQVTADLEGWNISNSNLTSTVTGSTANNYADLMIGMSQGGTNQNPYVRDGGANITNSNIIAKSSATAGSTVGATIEAGVTGNLSNSTFEAKSDNSVGLSSISMMEGATLNISNSQFITLGDIASFGMLKTMAPLALTISNSQFTAVGYNGASFTDATDYAGPWNNYDIDATLNNDQFSSKTINGTASVNFYQWDTSYMGADITAQNDNFTATSTNGGAGVNINGPILNISNSTITATGGNGATAWMDTGAVNLKNTPIVATAQTGTASAGLSIVVQSEETDWPVSVPYFDLMNSPVTATAMDGSALANLTKVEFNDSTGTEGVYNLGSDSLQNSSITATSQGTALDSAIFSSQAIVQGNIVNLDNSQVTATSSGDFVNTTAEVFGATSLDTNSTISSSTTGYYSSATTNVESSGTLTLESNAPVSASTTGDMASAVDNVDATDITMNSNSPVTATTTGDGSSAYANVNSTANLTIDSNSAVSSSTTGGFFGEYESEASTSVNGVNVSINNSSVSANSANAGDANVSLDAWGDYSISNTPISAQANEGSAGIGMDLEGALGDSLTDSSITSQNNSNNASSYSSVIINSSSYLEMTGSNVKSNTLNEGNASASIGGAFVDIDDSPVCVGANNGSASGSISGNLGGDTGSHVKATTSNGGASASIGGNLVLDNAPTDAEVETSGSAGASTSGLSIDNSNAFARSSNGNASAGVSAAIGATDSQALAIAQKGGAATASSQSGTGNLSNSGATAEGYDSAFAVTGSLAGDIDQSAATANTDYGIAAAIVGAGGDVNSSGANAQASYGGAFAAVGAGGNVNSSGASATASIGGSMAVVGGTNVNNSNAFASASGIGGASAEVGGVNLNSSNATANAGVGGAGAGIGASGSTNGSSATASSGAGGAGAGYGAATNSGGGGAYATTGVGDAGADANAGTGSLPGSYAGTGYGFWEFESTLIDPPEFYGAAGCTPLILCGAVAVAGIEPVTNPGKLNKLTLNSMDLSAMTISQLLSSTMTPQDTKEIDIQPLSLKTKESSIKVS